MSYQPKLADEAAPPILPKNLVQHNITYPALRLLIAWIFNIPTLQFSTSPLHQSLLGGIC